MKLRVGSRNAGKYWSGNFTEMVMENLELSGNFKPLRVATLLLDLTSWIILSANFKDWGFIWLWWLGSTTSLAGLSGS